jgi:hypothetical protein
MTRHDMFRVQPGITGERLFEQVGLRIGILIVPVMVT